MQKLTITILSVLFLGITTTIYSQPQTLTLEQSIELAKQNSPQIQAAQEAVQLAEGRVIEARAAMLPQVDVNGSYLYLGKLPTTMLDFGDMPFPSPFPSGASDTPSFPSEPIEIEMGAPHTWRGEVSIQQPLFTFGKLWYLYKQAIASRQAAESGLRAVQQQLRLQVTEAFYGVLLAVEYLKVAKQAVELVETQLKVAQQLRDAGTATDFEVLRAQVQLANVQSQKVRAENAHKLAQNSFKMVLGLDMNTNVNVEGEFAEESLRLAQLRYSNGMLTSVELIDSQLALTQSQVNRLQTLHDYMVGKARLRKAIGEE